jgi:hypothetical protein
MSGWNVDLFIDGSFFPFGVVAAEFEEELGFVVDFVFLQ